MKTEDGKSQDPRLGSNQSVSRAIYASEVASSNSSDAKNTRKACLLPGTNNDGNAFGSDGK